MNFFLTFREIVIQTLIAVISNILKYPEEKKFKSLNLTNQRVQKRILISDSAVSALTMLGFEIQGENMVCTTNKKENFEYFIDKAASLLKIIEMESEKKETKIDATEQPVKEEKKLEQVKEENKGLKKPKLKRYKIEKENQIFEIYEQYEVKKVLGFGAYGIVVLAYDNVRKKNVAIKKNFDIFKYDGEYQKRIFREVQIMLHFIGHPNVSF